MRKICICCIILFSLFGCVKKESMQNIASIHSPKSYDETMKQDLLCLMMAYPEDIKNIEKEKENVYIVMKSGKYILYDDRQKKSFDEKLRNPDLQDMMEQIYPLSDIKGLMKEDFDPGRFRVYSLFQEVYGISKDQVQSNLKNVKVGYQNYLFSEKNKASDSLQKVMNEMMPVIEKKNIYAYVFPISGTFNYRFISGTGQLSPHAFGIAIDLASDKRDYWKWTLREKGQERLKDYPREVVRIFEKYGFIWGGKWGHFDILHFEYRPEIILKAKYFSKKSKLDKSWYHNVSSLDSAKKYIRFIDQAFR